MKSGLIWRPRTVSRVFSFLFLFIFSIFTFFTDGKEAKAAFDNVKDAYAKAKKQPKSGSASSEKKNYVYAAQLSFLDKVNLNEKWVFITIFIA